MAMQVSPIDVQKALKGINYPTSHADLVEHARSNGAKDDILDALDGLPDRDYDSPASVEAALSD